MELDDKTISMLLDELKERLDITWADASMISKLKQLLKDSIADFFQKTGYEEFDFETNSVERELIFTRIQYAMENMLDDFSKNYRSEIIAMINRARVRNYASKKAETDSDI